MSNGINTYDLKTNIVSTVISTLIAIIVAIIVSTVMANSMKSAYADQAHRHQSSPVTLAASSNEETDGRVSACSASDSERETLGHVLGATTHSSDSKKSHSREGSKVVKRVTHRTTSTTTTNNHQSIDNGNVSNFGEDNDLVDVDDLVDVNAPVNANILNDSLNHNSVLNDVIDVKDNDLKLNVLSNLL